MKSAIFALTMFAASMAFAATDTKCVLVDNSGSAVVDNSGKPVTLGHCAK